MKRILFWVLSFLITVFFAVFQRMTGPTYPVKGSVHSDDNKVTASYKFPRSCTTGTMDCLLFIRTKVLPGGDALPILKWRRYKTSNAWADIPFLSEYGPQGMEYSAVLPSQPPAGKLEYVVVLKTASGDLQLGGGPVVTRFKGAVPGWILIPHIALMFLFMLFSVRIFLSAAFGLEPVKHSVPATVAFLLLGGFVFGPATQYYAFGQAWTGFPYGYDLTDNKTLVMLVFWLLALWAVLKEKAARFWLIAAFAVTALVYFVPHSMFGSELDYSKGQVVTGK